MYHGHLKCNMATIHILWLTYRIMVIVHLLTAIVYVLSPHCVYYDYSICIMALIHVLRPFMAVVHVLMAIAHIMRLSYTYCGQSTRTMAIIHLKRPHYMYDDYVHVLIDITRVSHSGEHDPCARR